MTTTIKEKTIMVMQSNLRCWVELYKSIKSVGKEVNIIHEMTIGASEKTI
jgi:hypothetical protein